ncbi:hypothetical protein ACFP1L_03615 [Lactiplantibacillus nangangensis]|uniref:Integral membrane protein n=1 Tax=Lactiplantibacillus nangangensis TaxID=2559917 RepID=A0ABW1SHJ1_9LACO|nr:hypothetical protein [Lactiplantibacillus nangangensis]
MPVLLNSQHFQPLVDSYIIRNVVIGMLIPEQFQVNLRKLESLNGFMLMLVWFLQLTGFKSKTIQPIRPIPLLLILTAFWVLSICSPASLRKLVQALRLDLQVVYLVYTAILVVLPVAFSTTALNDNGTAIGILISIVGVLIPYLPKQRVLGVQITDSRARNNWQLVIILGARISFIVGVTSFILGALSFVVFLSTLSVGFVSLLGGMFGYLRYLNRHSD